MYVPTRPGNAVECGATSRLASFRTVALTVTSSTGAGSGNDRTVVPAVVVTLARVPAARAALTTPNGVVQSPTSRARAAFGAGDGFRPRSISFQATTPDTTSMD